MPQLTFHNYPNNSFKHTPPPQRNFSNVDLSALQKIVESYKLWLNVLPNLRRITRESLGEKVNVLFIELLELVLTAKFSGRENKIVIIKKASLKLDLLKLFLQISWEIKAIDNKKFAELASRLTELGRMLGGWQKNLQNNPK